MWLAKYINFIGAYYCAIVDRRSERLWRIVALFRVTHVGRVGRLFTAAVGDCYQPEHA